VVLGALQPEADRTFELRRTDDHFEAEEAQWDTREPALGGGGGGLRSMDGQPTNIQQDTKLGQSTGSWHGSKVGTSPTWQSAGAAVGKRNCLDRLPGPREEEARFTSHMPVRPSAKC